MKKTLVLIPVFLLLLNVVSAVDMKITPQLVHLDHTDSKDVTVCVSKADTSPYAGLDLFITSECQDLNGDEACSPAENGNAAGFFSATVKTSPTDASGCGEVTLSTTNAAGGSFSYSVLSENAGVEVDSESGLAFVPEFTTVGAALALGGAGFFMYRRRKH